MVGILSTWHTRHDQRKICLRAAFFFSKRYLQFYRTLVLQAKYRTKFELLSKQVIIIDLEIFGKLFQND